MTYQEILADRIHSSMEERRGFNDSIKQSNNEFAKYLKENFDKQMAEFQEQIKKEEETIQENIRKEQEKSKFRKFIEKLIKIL